MQRPGLFLSYILICNLNTKTGLYLGGPPMAQGGFETTRSVLRPDAGGIKACSRLVEERSDDTTGFAQSSGGVNPR